MTLPMTEDQLLSAIIEAAHWHGWLVAHHRNSKAGVYQGDPGFPDLVCAKPGRAPLFLELKGEYSGRVMKVTEGQYLWRDALGGHIVYPKDLDAVLAMLA